MSMNALALTGLVLMFLFMLLRMPISFSMFIVGFLGLVAAASSKAAFTVITADLWSQFSSYTMTVIPLYILMGEIFFRTGMTDDLFKAAYTWVGQFKGGLANTVILASAVFSAICGSNPATAATIGTMAFPELKKYKYDEPFSLGTVAAGGTLGVIIPPSTVLLVIALQAEQSIRDLFVASIIPGVILTLLMMLTVVYLCSRNPELGPSGPRTSLREKLVSLKGVVPTLLLFGFVIGGLFWGWFTPTESAAFGAFGALVMAFVLGCLTKDNLQLAVAGTIRSSTMVIMLVVGAMVFGRFLTITRLPYAVAEWTNALEVAPVFIVLAIIGIFVIGGALMDALGFLIIAMPIFYPTIISLGYDPVWLAIMLCIVTSAGAITPPVGVCVFVVKGLSEHTPIMSIFNGAVKYLVAYVVIIALLLAFPQVVTFVLT